MRKSVSRLPETQRSGGDAIALKKNSSQSFSPSAAALVPKWQNCLAADEEKRDSAMGLGVAASAARRADRKSPAVPAWVTVMALMPAVVSVALMLASIGCTSHL